MSVYAFILYKTVREFAEILQREDVSAKVKAAVKARASTIRSWWSCARKTCDYYQVYQAYGPAELTHRGYHAAEQLAVEHFVGCPRRCGAVCAECEAWASRLRGEFWSTLMKPTTSPDTGPEAKPHYGFYQG